MTTVLKSRTSMESAAGTELRLRAYFVFAGALYIAVLLWSYRDVITANFAYYRYDFTVTNPGLFAMGIVLALLPTLWMPRRLSRPSILAYYMLYLMVHVPVVLVPLCTYTIDPVRVFPFSIAATFCFWLVGCSHHFRLVDIRLCSIDRVAFWAIVGLATLGSLLLITYYFGFHLQVHSLTDVYGVREEFIDKLSRAGPLTAYIVIWVANVICPFLLISGLMRRNVSSIVVSLVSLLLIFSITGLKQVLFSLPFLVTLFFVLRMKKSNFVILTIGLSAACVVVSVVDKFYGDLLWSSLFVRRTLLTPGLLAGFYHDFFSDNEKLWLSHSVFRWFLSYPYETRITYIIGETYLGSRDCGANVNFLADAFANFGYLGMVCFSGVLAFVFWFYDCIAKKIEYSMAALLLAIPAFSLSNCALLTVLATHGLGPLLVLMYCYSADGRSSREEGRPSWGR